MSIYQRHSEFYSRPIRLTEEQMEQPIGVVNSFFSATPLDEVREDISKLLECAMITDSEHFESPEQRASIICFLENLEECMEAAYLLSEKAKDKP